MYIVKLMLSLLFLLNSSMSHANPQSVMWFSHDAQKQVSINVDLFLSSTCPHCHKADAFFRDAEKKEPWLIVHRYAINQDKLALQTFYERLQQQHSDNFSVPAIFFCDSRWAGFADENTTGKALLHALSYCRQKIIQQGELSPATVSVLQKWGTASQIQISSNMAQSAFPLIPFTALSDGFSSCSIFCFAAFLAFMWLSPTRKWQQFSVGIIFIVSLGIIHYAQQAHAEFFYQNVLKWRLAAVLVGVLLLLAVFRDYRKMRSRAALSTGAWIFAAAIFTAFIVHIYQQTCELNLAVVFDQWLTEQAILPATRYFYQIVYQFFYLLPLVLLLLFFLLFGRSHWVAHYHQMLKIVAYLILASIGIILLNHPAWLANFWVSLVVFFVAIGAGWGWRRYEQVN